MKKVHCRYCKYIGYFFKLSRKHVCNHPSNKVVIKLPENAIDPEKEKTVDKFCEEINHNNDCKLYKPKFIVRLFGENSNTVKNVKNIDFP